MKTRPILMSAPMVRAILGGNKTQTRRPIAFPRTRDSFVLQNDDGIGWWPYQSDDGETPVCNDGNEYPYASPYGQPGDRLWVREAWRGVVKISPPDAVMPEYGVARYVPDHEHCERVEYAATQEQDGEPWRPSIHMPCWASRITLEVTGVRVERLQDISEADAWAEGIEACDGMLDDLKIIEAAKRMGITIEDARASYATLWDHINGAGAWDANPWVWVVEFKRVQP